MYIFHTKWNDSFGKDVLLVFFLKLFSLFFVSTTDSKFFFELQKINQFLTQI